MALHPLADRFASVAEEYELGRPEYPPGVVGALAAELDLPPAARVLDLAAGTGKLSRALLAGGLDVVAVEPQQALRERLVAGIGPERVRDGLAEAIPLPDGSVAAVTVADAIHWFDHAAALAEIARVLSDGGSLAVLTTVPDWSGASWAEEVGGLLAELRPAHPHFEGPPWQQAVRDSGRFEEPRELRITWWREADAERMVAHVGSMSWIAALEEPQRAATLSRVAELIEGGTTPELLPAHVIIGLARLRG
jgi:SAM-dependent methyltransferase